MVLYCQVHFCNKRDYCYKIHKSGQLCARKPCFQIFYYHFRIFKLANVFTHRFRSVEDIIFLIHVQLYAFHKNIKPILYISFITILMYIYIYSYRITTFENSADFILKCGFFFSCMGSFLKS